MKTDILIPSSPKDQNKLLSAINGLIDNCPEANDFYIICPDKSKLSLPDKIAEHCIYVYNDFEVVPDMLKFIRTIRFRPNWILQQIIKLCQNVTKTEYYFCVDSDLLLCNKLELFNKNGLSKLFAAPNPKDEEAFHRFIAKATGGDLFTWTNNITTTTNWIADCQLFKKQYVDEMISRYFPSMNDFMCFTALHSFWNGRRDNSIFISEYEMYGQYIFKYHPTEIFVEYITRRQIDVHQYSQYEQMFNEEYIKEQLKTTKEDGTQFLKLQSNCSVCDLEWKTK